MYKKIITLVKSVIDNKLFSSSAILLLGATISNVANYLYHLFMGRMLGPADYGLLASLISLTYIMSVPIGTIRLSLVKEVSFLYQKSNKIKAAYVWVLKKSFNAMILLLVLSAFLSPYISKTMNIGQPKLVFIVLASGIIGFYNTINQSFLQGLQKFISLSVSGVLSSIIKIITALALVAAGWGVFGATISFIVTAASAGIITYILLKKLLKNGNHVPFKPSIGFSSIVMPIFVFNLAHTSIYSTDIILAKKFLSSVDAGFYAALSTLGKVIFFAVSPVVMVMFPITSEKHSNGGNYKKIFKLSFLLVFLICLGSVFVYLFFPKIMVLALYGKNYLPVVPYLKYFALIFSFFSLSHLFISYYISIKKVKVVALYVLAAVAQIVAISFFHQNISQLITISLIIVLLLFISLLGYYYYSEKTKN